MEYLKCKKTLYIYNTENVKQLIVKILRVWCPGISLKKAANIVYEYIDTFQIKIFQFLISNKMEKQ